MKKLFIAIFLLLQFNSFAQSVFRIKEKDRNKDVIMVTDSGSIRLRLFDQTPKHRDNFLSLVKAGFYDGIAFHRIIQGFMIQAGNPETRLDKKIFKKDSSKFNYTIDAEFNPELFHYKGVLAAARMGDDVNPTKASSGTQFYIVQGRIFNDATLDSVETYRLKSKLPIAHREKYKSMGGAPHLDQGYTVFGEVIEGLDIVDKIASVKTAGRTGADRPIYDIRIQRAYLIKKNR